MKMIFFLLFFTNMASCAQGNISYCPDVFVFSEKGVSRRTLSPHTGFGLFLNYYENPVKSPKHKSSFCFLQYSVNYDNYGNVILGASVDCDFTASPPAFIVRKDSPDWVGCDAPLLRVGFQEKPLGTTTLSEAIVTKNAVKYPLPFVEGEDPQLNVFCESNKATIVFDFGPNTKKSTTIDFLHWAKSFSPPIVTEDIPLDLERQFREDLALSEKVYANIRKMAEKNNNK